MHFLLLMSTLQFHLLNWQGVGPKWAISFFFVYTGLFVQVYPQSHKLNLIYCLKCSLILGFCSLFLCMVDQIQMYPSSISPLGLFQVIICNAESLEGGTLEPLISREAWFERRGPMTSLHTMHMVWIKKAIC